MENSTVIWSKTLDEIHGSFGFIFLNFLVLWTIIFCMYYDQETMANCLNLKRAIFWLFVGFLGLFSRAL